MVGSWYEAGNTHLQWLFTDCYMEFLLNISLRKCSLPSPFSFAAALVGSWLPVTPSSFLPARWKSFLDNCTGWHLQHSPIHWPILLIRAIFVDVDLGDLPGTTLSVVASVTAAPNCHDDPGVVLRHRERLVLHVTTSSSATAFPTSSTAAH